jgi:hypothetical protein
MALPRTGLTIGRMNEVLVNMDYAGFHVRAGKLIDSTPDTEIVLDEIGPTRSLRYQYNIGYGRELRYPPAWACIL